MNKKIMLWWITAFVSLGTAFGLLAGGLQAVDRAVMNHEEHDDDVSALFEVFRNEQLRLKAYMVRQELNGLIEQRQRNAREIDRLDRDLAGGKYNNEDERQAMLRAYKRNQMSNSELKTDIDRLQVRLNVLEVGVALKAGEEKEE